MKIDQSICLVTGASSGIGAATARRLAERGARVVIAARRGDRLDALAAEIDAVAVVTDVTSGADLDRLFASIREDLGGLQVVVNNAGQGLHVPLEQLRADDLRAVFELNVVAPLEIMQRALPLLRAGRGGSIVNVSSATTLRVFPGLGGYASTKAALNMISAVARREWAADGVVVSTVYPSVTATEFHDKLRAGQLVRGAHSIVPDPPEVVADAIIFAIEGGDEDVMVGPPARAVTRGDDASEARRP